MLFNSLTFLIVFLPLVLVLYSGGGTKWKNAVLIFSSLLYYAWGGVSFSIVLLLSIFINYLIGRKVGKKNKNWLIIGIVINVTALIIFKYLDFFIQNINLILTTEIPLSHIRLPLGISFFTFHGISFLVDIYRSERIEKIRLGETTLYLSFFPQLIAGPIIRFHDIIDQIRSRKHSLLGLNEGIQRFIIGLFKKVVIANSMGALADKIMVQAPEDLSSPVAWLGIIAYTFQIYYDFSGYSDMAIGLGNVFGFKILENFNYPYISRSIREFWKRWHISLTNWFRDYVYIPMGGNRKGKARTYLHLISIFLLTGFWHGATWSFVFWGVFHGTFMMVERLFLGKYLEKIPSIFSWLYMIVVVMIGWVFFRIEDFDSAFHYTQQLFIFQMNGSQLNEYLNVLNTTILCIATLLSAPIYPSISNYLSGEKTSFQKIINFAKVNLLLPILFIYCIMILCGSSYNPFIYFRF